MQCKPMPWFLFVFSIAFLLTNQKEVEGMKRKKDGPPMDTNVAGSSKKRAPMEEPHQQIEELSELPNEEQHIPGLQNDDQIELKSNVWKICIANTNQVVFNKLNKDEAECLICKGKEGRQYIYKTSHGSTTSLINHLKSKHKESEEYEQFLELERAKKGYNQTMQINKTLEEKKTKRSWSNIWKICIAGTNQKVFNRLNTDEAECLICKGKEGRQYIFKTSNYKTTDLIRHMKSTHNESEECKQYLDLERAKEDRHSSLQIDEPRIRVESEETKTKHSWSKIWKICIAGTDQKVFNRLNREQSECLLCKGKEGRQYIFKTPDFRTTNLGKHLKSTHNESEECKQYLLELERAKEDRHSSLQIDQHRIRVESEALLHQQEGNLTGESSNTNVMHTMSTWATGLQRNHDNPIYQENETRENAPPLNHQQANQQQSTGGSRGGPSPAVLPRQQQLLLSSSSSSKDIKATSLTIIPDNGIVVFKQIPGGFDIWMSKINIHNHGLIPQKFNVESTNAAIFNIMPKEDTLKPDKHATVDLTFESDNLGSVNGSEFFIKAHEGGKENIWTFEARIEQDGD